MPLPVLGILQRTRHSAIGWAITANFRIAADQLNSIYTGNK